MERLLVSHKASAARRIFVSAGMDWCLHIRADLDSTKNVASTCPHDSKCGVVQRTCVVASVNSVNSVKRNNNLPIFANDLGGQPVSPSAFRRRTVPGKERS